MAKISRGSGPAGNTVHVWSNVPRRRILCLGDELNTGATYSLRKDAVPSSSPPTAPSTTGTPSFPTPPASSPTDRLTHHAYVTLIDGDSYRRREDESEARGATQALPLCIYIRPRRAGALRRTASHPARRPPRPTNCRRALRTKTLLDLHRLDLAHRSPNRLRPPQVVLGNQFVLVSPCDPRDPQPAC